MKLFKKVFASVCAISMVASAFAALTITASADAVKPVLYPVVIVDEAAKTAKVEVYASGLPAQTDDEYGDQTYIAAMALQVDVSSYSNTDISTMSARNFSKWADAHYTSFDATLAPATASGVNVGYLSVSGAYTGAAAMKNSAAAKVTGNELLICTIKDIDLTDAALADGFTVKIANDDSSFASIKLSNEYLGSADEYGMTYKKGAGADTLTVNSASWKPATPEEPKPDYVYDEKNPSATNWKAADTDVAPSVYEGTDGSKAVGAKATVNPGSDKNTYTGLVWKVKSADGAKTYTYTQGVNITGAADFVYGIVINGATESDVDLNSFGVAVK